MRQLVLKSIILVLFISWIHQRTSAQSYSHNFQCEFELIPTGEILGEVDSTYFLTATLGLEDTTTVSEIAVKLGTSNGASDLLLHDFVFDQTTSLPGQCTFQRNGNTVTLELSTQSAGVYYLEVFLRDNNGNITSSIYRSNMP